jgi:GH24 family phage-related lysozyme (muramidase)
VSEGTNQKTKAAGAKPVQPKRKEGAKPTKLSMEGAKFIANFEGFRGKMYDDAAGHCTIGYGHLVHLGRTTGREAPEYCRGITKERALEILQADAAKACSTVRSCVKVPLNQHQLDALTSFAFNVGGDAFRQSTLLKKLNAGDYAAVPHELNRWNKAGGRPLEGLTRRRGAEGALFARGKY